jgi:predicted aspartyl protease
MTRAYPGEGTSPLCGLVAKEHFLTALDDREMELKIREREPKDLEVAFKHAIRLEALVRAVDGHTSSQHDDNSRNRGRRTREDQLSRRVAELERQTTTNASNSQGQPAVQQPNCEVQQLKGQLEEMGKEMGRLKALLTVRDAMITTPTGTWSNPSTYPGPQARRETAGQRYRQNVTGYNCNGTGHFARDCTEPRRQRDQQAQPSNEQPQPRSVENPPSTARCDGVSSSPTNVIQRKIYLQLYINGTLRKCLMDTGSDVTLLPTYATRGALVEACTQRLRAANGTSVAVKVKVLVQAGMGDHRLMISGLASDHIVEVILGNDFLHEHDALWDFKNGELTLDGIRYELCTGEPPQWCRRVILQSDCSVPRRSEALLPTKVMYNDHTTRASAPSQWITEAHTMPCGLQVSSTILPDGDSGVPVRVLNPSSCDIALKAGAVISNLEQAAEVYELGQE